MSLWRQLTRGIRALAHRPAADSDVRAEVQDYLARAIASHTAAGLSPEAAMRAARLDLGNTTVAEEQLRSYGWENRVDTLAADLRYAFRRLRTNPGFTIVSVLTLAIGIGATSAIFSTVNPILFASLPFPHAEQLVTVMDADDDGTLRSPTLGTFYEIRARGRSFASVTAADRWQPSLTGTSQPERLVGQRVSASYFSTLGVRPTMGRDFSDDDDQVGGPKVVIVSPRLIQRRFAGDSTVIGRKITLDDGEYTIIGAMPRDFSNVLVPAADVWSPLQEAAHSPFNSRQWGHHYRVVGRLAPGADGANAAREMRAIGKAPTQEFPRPDWASMKNGLVVRSLQNDIARDATPTLLAIIGAALLLLAIASVNVTNLLMARGAQRRGEFAMRIALGAGRGRLLRQLLTESLVLAGAGGALGLVVAQAGIKTLIAFSPPGLPRVDAIRLDGSVFVFALGVTTIVGIVVGIVPALGAARSGLRVEMQRRSRASSGTGLARNVLVVGEVALALMLLTGAGLLIHSLQRLFAVAPGFNPEGVITMQVTATGRTANNDTSRARFFEAALDAARHLPGVTAAAFTSQLPLSGDLDGYGFELQSKPSATPEHYGSVLRYSVSPDYFAAMGIPLLRGRLLGSTDRLGAPEAIVVSESFAKRAFGAANPIGQQIRIGPEAGNATRPWDVIVGVVGNVKQESLAASETDAFYVAMTQWWWVDGVQSLVVRTSSDAAALAPSLKRAVWFVDANQPIQRVATMDGLVRASASQRRFALVVIETFAVAALLLAAIGLYGVIAGGVAERTREIGIRAALGATPGSIVGSVVARGIGLASIGIVFGLAGAVASSNLLVSLLFGVSRLDLATYTGVIALLGGVSAIACWIPASRAARVDPAITLRAD